VVAKDAPKIIAAPKTEEAKPAIFESGARAMVLVFEKIIPVAAK